MAPELKQAYRILKQAGFITENIENKKEMISQHDLLTSATDGKVKIDIQNRNQFDTLAKESKFHTSLQHIQRKFMGIILKVYEKPGISSFFF